MAVMLAATLGCGADPATRRDAAAPCQVEQPYPYPSGSPFLGVHANPQNNDVVRCTTAEAFEQTWHVLQGLAVVQFVTFSPDGGLVYATSANPEPDGCRLHAIDAENGRTVWCRTFPPSIAGSAAVVDAEGYLYFTAEEFVHSLSPDGSDRWRTRMPPGDIPGSFSGPLGLHFSPDGHIATVTNGGVVLLVGRQDGEILASLDIPATWGFVPPASTFAFLDLGRLLPEELLADLAATFGTAGDPAADLGAMLGASGGFSDNTVGVSIRNEIFAVGGGADPRHGALVQIRIEGSAEKPRLVPGWHMPIRRASATSPSVSFDGRYVSVGDGVGLAAILFPRLSRATIQVVDVDECDANRDADADPMVCAPATIFELDRGPLTGSPPLADDGTVYHWEANLFDLDYEEGSTAVDVREIRMTGVGWEKTLPDDLTWSGGMTVTNNLIFGAASKGYPSDTTILGVRLPSRVESHLIAIDRFTGETVWRAPARDAAIGLVAIGPRGSLYSANLGAASIMATDQSPVHGLIKFSPVRAHR